ncbi:MAG TPA: peptidylprolyl isomerase, partial [Thiolapillus brandeum]|nr:peptidylprolyl isomerase [Thiolapillus brandeum]
MGAEIQPGSRVKIHFRLSLEDGTEALSTLGEEPL